MNPLWVGSPTTIVKARDVVVGDVINHRGARLWKVTEIGEDADGRFFRVTVYRGAHTATLRPGATATFAKAGHVKTKEEK